MTSLKQKMVEHLLQNQRLNFLKVLLVNFKAKRLKNEFLKTNSVVDYQPNVSKEALLTWDSCHLHHLYCIFALFSNSHKKFAFTLCWIF